MVRIQWRLSTSVNEFVSWVVWNNCYLERLKATCYTLAIPIVFFFFFFPIHTGTVFPCVSIFISGLFLFQFVLRWNYTTAIWHTAILSLPLNWSVDQHHIASHETPTIVNCRDAKSSNYLHNTCMQFYNSVYRPTQRAAAIPVLYFFLFKIFTWGQKSCGLLWWHDDKLLWWHECSWNNKLDDDNSYIKQHLKLNGYVKLW